jgi:hypothetical protein
MIDMNPKMGVTSSKPTPFKLLDPNLPFSAAGILFSNDTHVLAGYQPHKKQPCITGIGGSKKEGEPALQTAWRETIEELFECETIPPKLLQLCERNFPPHHWFSRGDYICFQYSFEDLLAFLNLVKRVRLSTSLYESYPTTLLELLMNRKHSETSEIQSLCLLPFVRETTGLLHIHEEFCLDMDQSF